MTDGRYSIIGIYRKYKNGAPISEIVGNTGVKRKTWNKRFERLEKKHEPATSGDSLATETGVTGRKGDKSGFLFFIFIVALIIVFIIAAKSIIEKYNEWKKKSSSTNSENNNKNVAT